MKSESEIDEHVQRLKFRARFEPQQKQILDELNEALRLRHPQKAAA